MKLEEKLKFFPNFNQPNNSKEYKNGVEINNQSDLKAFKENVIKKETSIIPAPTNKIKTGAIPKLTKSVSESNSLPNSDVPFIKRAILPSNASSMAANKIKITAKL